MEIKDLGKSYGSAEILKEINLTIEQGSVLALIGPTGSGKTTLLRLVNLLERPSSGQHHIQRPGGLRPSGERAACSAPQHGHGLSKAGDVQG